MAVKRLVAETLAVASEQHPRRQGLSPTSRHHLRAICDLPGIAMWCQPLS